MVCIDFKIPFSKSQDADLSTPAIGHDIPNLTKPSLSQLLSMQSEKDIAILHDWPCYQFMTKRDAGKTLTKKSSKGFRKYLALAKLSEQSQHLFTVEKKTNSHQGINFVGWRNVALIG